LWGELGIGTTGGHRTVPTAVHADLGGTPVLLAAGKTWACAVLGTGVTKCWGDNGVGQVGDGTNVNKNKPTAVHSDLGGTPVLLAAGGIHTCAVLHTGFTKCWGGGSRGQLGDGSTAINLTPQPVQNLGGTSVLLALGEDHTCAVLDTGVTKCWGRNYYGQIGNGVASKPSQQGVMTPTEVHSDLGGTPVLLAAGKSHTCAVLGTGVTKCWGRNDKGQLGDGTITDRTTPTEVSSMGGTPIALSAGPASKFTCAVLDSGVAKCWGDNANGHLGIGSTGGTRLTPATVQVS